MHIATCIPEADLLRLFRGSLPETESAAVEEHLLHCGPCLDKLKTLSRSEDSLAALLREDSPHKGFSSSPVLADLMKQLKALRPSSTCSVNQGVAMLSLICTACRKKLTVKDTAAGKKVKCPGCGHILAVPAPVAIPGSDCTLPPDPQPSGSEQPQAAPGNRPTHSGSNVLEATCAGKTPDDDRDASLTDFLAPPQADDELGRLGKYRVLKILGHGGMGVVYKAEDPKLERKVALKAMLPGMAVSASAGKRFLREAKAMAAVKHDHIVTIYQVDEERGVPFLAMEFLAGEPLDERIQREEKLPVLEVLRLGREIAEGLGAAHATGLIHRDIKPGNVWLEAPRSRVKILDFGLARSAEQESGLTQQGAIIGTPAYMAPEQARGDPVDARSDLFSLGVVLYRLCSGKSAFQGRDTISTLMAVATDEPPPPIALNPKLPVELSDLVMALLQKDPERRPASAAAVVEALQGLEKRLFREQEPHEQAETLLVAAKKKAAPAKSRRRLLVAIAAGLVLLIGGVATALIIVQIRDKHGKVVGEYAMPEGGDVRLIPAGPAKLPSQPGAIDDAWFKQVAALSPVKQVDAVAAKLKERNPGFDGKVELRKVEGGKVTEIWFSATKVEDISPVRALEGLKTFNCRGSNVSDLSPLKDMKLTDLNCSNSHVSNLSPLKDMKLTTLDCSNTHVSELSPLKDMRLTRLDCHHTTVDDLSPLKNMPLTVLICDQTRVIDLSPLKGMPLTELVCSQTQVSDLSPLKDMKLTHLDCWQTKVCDLLPLKDMKLTILNINYTLVSDLSPLKGMPLTWLDCRCQVCDLSPLKGMKLTYLGCSGQRLSDLSPLKDMKLTHLVCEQTKVCDLSPLKDMKLTNLNINYTLVSDLSPLKGMPLTYLNCSWTQVSDLSPLKGMPLRNLNIQVTQVSDLSPLKGMPLTKLECNETKVSDLSPLKGVPLKDLKCDFKPERDAEILRAFKTLERINDKPAAVFWKEVDAAKKP